MGRQQNVRENFRRHFDKLKTEKILIYGRGIYAKLLIEEFPDYAFIGIIDRLDLEGSYCGLPILKCEEVLQSGAHIIMIAASRENTELIRKRIGNFCIRNQFRLYSVDGRCLNIDDCMIKATEHPSHNLSRENLRIAALKSKILYVELKAFVLKTNGKYEFRRDLIEDLHWVVKQQKKVFLLIDSYEDEWYRFFHTKEATLEKNLIVKTIQEHGIYHELVETAAEEEYKECLYIGLEGSGIAEKLGLRVYAIYDPIEMLVHSTYQELYHPNLSQFEKNYIELIASQLFNSPYALYGTGGKVQIEKAYDIGYVLLGPIIMDFLLWFVQKLREKKAAQVIFSARDGYLFQQLYELIKEKEGFTDLPDAIYFYTSRIVSNLAGSYCADDIEKQIKAYFKGTLQEMLMERFALDKNLVATHSREQYESDLDYIKSFEKEILQISEKIRKNYRIYIDTLPLKDDQNTVFFDLFASGTCQLTLEKIKGIKYQGLYFSKYWTEDAEKLKLNIDEFLEFDPFMGDHSMFMESILTSFEPTLSSVDENGKLHFGEETRSERELGYVQEAQKGIADFVESALRGLSVMPEQATSCGKEIFEKIVSKYTVIENDIFKNRMIRDEILHRNQYLGDFYQY